MKYYADYTPDGKRQKLSMQIMVYFPIMKSPFPGMDPYLEQHWEDVHTALIGYIRDELQPQLSGDLIARMEEKVYVEDEGETRLRKPDVRIAEVPMLWHSESGAASTSVLDEPILLEPMDDPMLDRSVLIYDSAGNRIITAIEILSPWNKTPGKALQAYLAKRKKYINSEINLIEIDLVRAGDWTRMIGSYPLPQKHQTTYRVTVHEPDVAGIYLYPIPLNARLPNIKVPLRPHDTPAKLALQPLLEKAYAMGRYDHIDYSKPCVPPFEGVEKEFASQFTTKRTS